jgi:hypothetical protein
MRVFIDFEASSLRKNGFPVEVGWVFEDGRPEGHLIRPAPGWSDWDASAEAIHKIPRQRLEREGTPHGDVARRMVEALSGHDLFASAPSWDGKWLSLLLRAAGFPRHSLRLRDSEIAQAEAAAALLDGLLTPGEAAGAIREIIGEVREAAERTAPRHRAVDDAEGERQRWLAVRRRAGRRRRRCGAGKRRRFD